ncbi:MAG: hypothetical protein AMXMBFR13_36300 [Phycisphaerae bacterium]
MSTKKHILFVDDEPLVIEGLRRMLRKFRGEWDMEFVNSGPDALARMAASPYDVIVSDIRMPGMDGAELLERVVKLHPATARIVLSGHAGEDSTQRALKVAHRFLAKPTDADAIRNAVAEACGAQQIVGDDHLRGLVAGCNSLPSAPAVYLELTKAIESEKSDAKQIAAIISRDMAMSAKILQMVNSSFFGIGRRISSVEHTVALLGLIRLRALVLGEQIFRQFVPPREVPGFSIDWLWRHSMAVAELARQISRAEKQEGDRPDQAFTAGLLHDLGLLVLAARQFEKFADVLTRARAQQRPIHEVEKEMMGVTHEDVGAYLLRLWGLPPRIIEAVELHHRPAQVEFDGLCALSVIHVADVLVHELNAPEDDAGRAAWFAPVDEAYLSRLKLSDRYSHWRELGIKACGQPEGATK